MKTRSAKSKGRSLQNFIRDSILSMFPELTKNDVRSCIMGDTGIDIKLSEKARQSFPFAVEARKRERLNIWQTITDAERHAEKEKLHPLGVISRNRLKEPYVLLRWDIFLRLLKLNIKSESSEEN